MKPSKLNLFHVNVWVLEPLFNGNNRINGCDGTNNEHFNRATPRYPSQFSGSIYRCPCYEVSSSGLRPFSTISHNAFLWKTKTRTGEHFQEERVLKTMNSTDLAIWFSWMQQLYFLLIVHTNTKAAINYIIWCSNSNFEVKIILLSYLLMAEMFKRRRKKC